jgi:hypothetical protein
MVPGGNLEYSGYTPGGKIIRFLVDCNESAKRNMHFFTIRMMFILLGALMKRRPTGKKGRGLLESPGGKQYYM